MSRKGRTRSIDAKGSDIYLKKLAKPLEVHPYMKKVRKSKQTFKLQGAHA